MFTSAQLTPTQFILLFVTSFITLVIFYVKRKHAFWERQNVKGPKPTFIFGNTFENLKYSLPEMYRNYDEKYGKVFGTYDGLQPHLNIGDSEILRTICVKDFTVFPASFHTVYLNPVEENFLTFISGPKWKRMRSMLSPTFTTGKMKKMFKLIKSCAQDAKAALTKLCKIENGAFEPKTFWGRYNTDVIAKCCFAANLDVYSDENSTLQQNFTELFTTEISRILFIFLAPECLQNALKISLFRTKNLEYLRDLSLALIEKRKTEKEKVEDFLQSLIDSESSEVDNTKIDTEKVKLTSEEIVSSSLVFLIAGFETTSTLLTWACYRLSLNPNIQEKLFNEVSKADIQDYDVLSGLTYLDAVINESLRIDPPIIVFQRTAHEDYTLPGTNIFIPKHTRITIPVYAIHHDPDNYSDPEEFKPERFINESPKPFTFLPFGAGPRICIGMRFALINAKLSLATLVRNYKILPTRETPTPMSLNYDKGSLVLMAQQLKLKIEPRSCKGEMLESLIAQWILLILTASISWFLFFARSKHTYWTRQGIKGPKPTFVIGNTFSGLDKSVVEILTSRYNKYGKVYGVYDGLQPHLVVGDPELLRHICVKDFHIFPQSFRFASLHPIEESFLINVCGDKWKRIRSLLTPTFSSGKLKKMFSLMKVCVQDAKSQLTLMTTSKEDDSVGMEAQFDPKYFWGRYNMDVIAKCCFATSLNVYDNSDDIFLRNFTEFFQGNPFKLLSFAVAPGWILKALKLSFFPTKNLEFLRDLTLALIEKRKNKDNKADDFLQLLLDLESENEPDKESESSTGKKSQLTSDEIVGASIIFLVAGYETTSTLLTWACYRLATNPEIQEKLFQEVSNSDIFDYEVLNSLPYLDAVLSETLRIDSPIIMFQRHAHADYILPGTSVKIEKGTPVTIPIYAIHHDPEHYPEPEIYDPNRFLNGSVKPFTFCPFGAGPRICIGMRFALINAKLSLAVLIRNFCLFTTDATPVDFKYGKATIILTAEDLKLGLKPRTST
ncbi:uncharacterized protein LOC128396055 [Panonychus citri]|uniref:uncharacterized protein LOC128396055 n=1 Tax=Panonychus citri TaxID=50023 RepID=UPI0023080921|nr:uncharacterized protein LOC128396055 [Panonychus citri]